MKIEMLFPEICNLYGDPMNVDYLVRSYPEIQVVKTSLKSEPLFVSETPSLIYMGPMTERSQELVVKALTPYKDRIKELIEDGAAFLITGNAIEIFGKYIENEDGSKIECLGLFDTYAKRRMMNRYNSLFLGKFGSTTITAFKSQFSHSYGDAESLRLFRAERGAGLNPDVNYEGIRKNNFFATYLIGPLLPMNPKFTAYLLRVMGVEDPKPAFEDAAEEAFSQRLAEFRDPKVALD